MTSWMAERDRLLAQADAMVKELGGRWAKPATADIVATPVLPERDVARPTLEKPAAGEADQQPLSLRRPRSDAQNAATVAIPMAADTLRDDIAVRVAKFREQQTRLGVERQAFYELKRRELLNKIDVPPPARSD
jgi:hypothetical protein